MFGLEDQKKKKKSDSKDFEYDLERELNQLKLHKELKVKIEGRIQKLKSILRAGEDKGNFDQIGTVLHGYTSLLKVMSRFTPKN